MSTLYIPRQVPQEYDPVFLTEELQRISTAMAELEVLWVIISPQNVAPSKTKEGMIVNADGTNWNPGGGAGIYAYTAGAWVKL